MPVVWSLESLPYPQMIEIFNSIFIKTFYVLILFIYTKF